jgi:hypothetical protein
MKRMTESRRRYLRKCRTLRAGGIGGCGTRINFQLSVSTKNMAQFMKHSTLLGHNEHSQEA